MTSSRYATVACLALGVLAGALLGVRHGGWGVQAALIGLAASLRSQALPARAGAARLFAFHAGWCAAAYAHFAIGVPAGFHLLACVPVILLVVSDALCAAAGGYLALRMRVRPWMRGVFLVPAFWMFQEWLFAQGKLAFPWARLGDSQAPDGPLAGYLALGGSLLASGLMLSCAALVVEAWHDGRGRGRVASCVGLSAILVVGRASLAAAWTEPTEALRVDLVQSGLSAFEKLREDHAASLLRMYLDAVSNSDAQLLVTPQLALPRIPEAMPAGYLDRMRAALVARGGDAIVGMYFQAPGSQNYYNGVLALGVSGTQHYLKHQLFPFGEFLPLSGAARALVQRAWPEPVRDTVRAPVSGATIQVSNHRVALALCYEAAFSQAWRARAVAADLLLNVSSDSAVDTAPLARQFLQIAQARALELRKPVLRSSDVRGTYLVDDRGRVTQALPAVRRGVLKVAVTGRTGLTPYARFGDALPLSIALGSLVMSLFVSVLPRGLHAAPAPGRRPLSRVSHARVRQRGQVLPLSTCLLLVASGMFYLMVNAGQSVAEKMRVTNAADAAAYSAGVVEARALNYDAYLNRAMVANEIVIAQLVSYASWCEYFASASDNYELAAGDISFFLLPDARVYLLDTILGGTEFATHYDGETARAYADDIVDEGIGPLVTANDAVVQVLSASQAAVQANLLAGVRQAQIANDVARAIDPAMHAEVVAASHGFDAFTKDYARDGDGDERGRIADVVVRSRDDFTRQRNWTIASPSDIPLVRSDGALKKRAGTELVGYDEWRGVDTLELHGQRFGCGRFGLSWCDDIREPVGWGAVEVDAGGGDASHGDPGNAYADNPTTAQRADIALTSSAHYAFHGMPDTRDIDDLDPKNPVNTGITVLVSKSQSATLTSGNAAANKPAGRLALFGDRPSGGRLLALSRATIFFDRIARRDDGQAEIGSLYNPYWRVHLTAPTSTDRAYAAALQDGMAMPDSP